MFIQTDKMDKLLYRDSRNANPGIPELEDKGKPQLPTWPDAVTDIWAGLFKADPKLEEAGESPLAEALQEVMETQEWKNLRQHTKLDDLGSTIGTVTFGNDFLEKLPPEVLEAEKQRQELKNMQEGLESIKDAGAGPNTINKIQKLLTEKEKQAAAAMQAAQQATGGDVAQAVRVAARAAAKHAKDDAQQAQQVAAIWGDGEGAISNIPLAEQVNVARKVSANKHMKRLAEMLGRLIRLAQGSQARKVDRCPEEIVDIETGSDLKSVLPSELALAGHPAANMLFKKRFLDNSLLQYKKQGAEKVGRGPVIVMIDESGSMSGDKIIWAKAVGLAMAWVAKKQRRDIWLGGFSSGKQCDLVKYPGGKISPADLEKYLERFFSGGTDFELALDKCVEAIETHKGRKADVLFISDGECYISDEYCRAFKKKKHDLGFKVNAVCVGADVTSFTAFCDGAFAIGENLAGDDVVLEKVFRI